MKHFLGRKCSVCIIICSVLLGICYAYGQGSGPAPRHKPFPLKSYEVLTIGKVVSTPELYNLQFVRLQGTIEMIQQVPLVTVCGQGIAFVLTVKDDTGQIKILDRGRCGQNFGNIGPLPTSALASGDMVDVLVLVSYVQQPGKESGEVETILNWVEKL